jgi:hypothetical protein
MTALPNARPLPPGVGAGVNDVSRERPPGLYFAGVVPFPPVLTRSRPAPDLLVPDANPPRDTEPAYAFLAALLGQAGLRIDRYRPGALLRRIPACLRALGVNSIPEAAQRLAARPALAWSVLDVVLLGVTEFCRDPGVFQYLRTTIPAPSGPDRGFAPRSGAPGCSEGQELYSVAGCLAIWTCWSAASS